MTIDRRLPALLLLIAWLGIAPRLVSQDSAAEISELRRRIAVMRTEMPSITAAAEYAADLATRDTAMRFFIPSDVDPALKLEFTYHAGGPPDVGDAAIAGAHALIIVPVQSWEGTGLGALMRIQRWNESGKPVIVLGSTVGKPKIQLGQAFLDNAAPDDGARWSQLNQVAETVLLWTWYSEFVAAATRNGWQPGIYLSVVVPGAADWNDAARFRMPDVPRPAPIAAGQLGMIYLRQIDSLLSLDETSSHRAAIAAAADTLRAVRDRGGRLFAAGCGHVAMEALPRDITDSAFHGIDWRWDVAGKVTAAGGRRGDAMLWLGYVGYDCPNIEVAGSFADLGLRVVVATNAGDHPQWLPEVAAYVPLAWRIPDAVVPVPFGPGHLGAVSSVEMMINYLWLRRLVAR